MYIITVTFEIFPHHYPAFISAMVANAMASLAAEPGCKQFDVCESNAMKHTVFLYEAYESSQDFQDHLATQHFVEFNALTQSWVRNKEVKMFNRLSPVTALEKR